MRRFPRRRIRRDIVEIRGTVAPDRSVRHGLARGDGGLVFEVEEVVRFLGDIEMFEVPYCGAIRTQSGWDVDSNDRGNESCGKPTHFGKATDLGRSAPHNARRTRQANCGGYHFVNSNVLKGK